MLKAKEFTEYLKDRGTSPERIAVAVKAVKAASSYFEAQGKRFEESLVNDFRQYVSLLMETGGNTEETLVD
ncbi:hypothetical protein MCGE09_00551, partial [Thaumarchaeota archaeon SCGC AB-539-E09]